MLRTSFYAAIRLLKNSYNLEFYGDFIERLKTERDLEKENSYRANFESLYCWDIECKNIWETHFYARCCVILGRNIDLPPNKSLLFQKFLGNDFGTLFNLIVRRNF